METTHKQQKAIIIKNGMAEEFLNLLSSSKVTKAYWDECADSNRNLSAENIEKLKKICNGEKG